MTVFDTHAHVLLPGTMGACGSAGPELTGDGDAQQFRAGGFRFSGVRFRGSPMGDADLRLALMDRLGIDRQLLSPYPMVYFYDQPERDAIAFSRCHNDEMAALVRRHPGRFAGAATLPMQAPDAAREELVRAVEELGLCAAYVGRRFGRRGLDDPDYAPLWRECERLEVPVFVHPGPMDGALAADPQKWDMSLVLGFAADETLAIAELVFGGVLDRHPGLTVVIPHGGGFAPYVRSRFEMAIARRASCKGLIQRPLDAVWNQLVFDCLVHDRGTLEYLVRAHGASRVVLGTNFAAWDQDDHVIDELRALPVTAVERDAMLGGNALALLTR